MTDKENRARQNLIHSVNYADEHNLEDASINVYDAEILLTLINQLQSKVMDLEHVNDRLGFAKEQLQNKLNTFEESNKNLTCEIKNLTKDINQLQKENEHIKILYVNEQLKYATAIAKLKKKCKQVKLKRKVGNSNEIKQTY